MKHLKIYESMWDGPSPPDYEDGPDPEELGREIEYTEAEQLFTPIYVPSEQLSSEGPIGRGNGQIDYDLLMDKTPEKFLWAVHVIDDAISDLYKMVWNTSDGEQYIQDEEAVINFATDEFRAGRYSKGFEAWEKDINNFALKGDICLIKLVSPEDVDYVLEDLSNYLSPSHASYHGKMRAQKLFSTKLSPGRNAMAKRAIRALEIYKRRIISNTVGGPNQH
jgi:hypothetical protein